MHVKTAKDLQRLRRTALHAQGLTPAGAFGRSEQSALAAIQHLGYVQLDSISVIERAHNHTWFSRIPNFHPDQSNQLLEQGDIYEYWAHAASYMPMRDFRFSLIDKARIRSGEYRNKLPNDTKMMNRILAQIRSDGPMSTKDLENPGVKRSGWWDWKPAKKAAERLYLQGDLMISSRAGFQKTYDLTERVLPGHIDTSMPSVQD
ncbi:MAG: crosslink repair DNA glycosylase YcaQ family protein, partial [Pseudomonadota bacterium]|nr:crosslink repair DNA glycosylase YcaQ family protein [Pseudomonadota bacterium]